MKKLMIERKIVQKKKIYSVMHYGLRYLKYGNKVKKMSLHDYDSLIAHINDFIGGLIIHGNNSDAIAKKNKYKKCLEILLVYLRANNKKECVAYLPIIMHAHSNLFSYLKNNRIKYNFPIGEGPNLIVHIIMFF